MLLCLISLHCCPCCRTSLSPHQGAYGSEPSKDALHIHVQLCFLHFHDCKTSTGSFLIVSLFLFRDLVSKVHPYWPMGPGKHVRMRWWTATLLIACRTAICNLGFIQLETTQKMRKTDKCTMIEYDYDQTCLIFIVHIAHMYIHRIYKSYYVYSIVFVRVHRQFELSDRASRNLLQREWRSLLRRPWWPHSVCQLRAEQNPKNRDILQKESQESQESQESEILELFWSMKLYWVVLCLFGFSFSCQVPCQYSLYVPQHHGLCWFTGTGDNTVDAATGSHKQYIHVTSCNYNHIIHVLYTI